MNWTNPAAAPDGTRVGRLSGLLTPERLWKPRLRRRGSLAPCRRPRAAPRLRALGNEGDGPPTGAIPAARGGPPPSSRRRSEYWRRHWLWSETAAWHPDAGSVSRSGSRAEGRDRSCEATATQAKPALWRTCCGSQEWPPPTRFLERAPALQMSQVWNRRFQRQFCSPCSRGERVSFPEVADLPIVGGDGLM